MRLMLKDLLYPKFCLNCHTLGTYICLTCEKKLETPFKDICIYCRRASYLGFTHPACRKKYGIDGVLSVYHYNPTLRNIIKNIKYRLVRDALTDLLKVIRPQQLSRMAEFKKIKHDACLQPVPLHENRKKKRGFNQSQIISNYFANMFSYRLIDCVEKIKDTLPQASLDKSARYENIKGAFVCKNNTMDGKKIVVIDDVITTGNTVKEVAWLLKRAGAKEVFAFSLVQG